MEQTERDPVEFISVLDTRIDYYSLQERVFVEELHRAREALAWLRSRKALARAQLPRPTVITNPIADLL